MSYTTANLADSILPVLIELVNDSSITVRRTRRVSEDRQDIVGTTITVVPFGRMTTLEAVGTRGIEYDVRVIVQRVLTESSDQVEPDALAAVTELISDGLVGQTLLGSECESAKMQPAYSVKRLQELNVFECEIQTKWKTVED